MVWLGLFDQSGFSFFSTKKGRFFTCLGNTEPLASNICTTLDGLQSSIDLAPFVFRWREMVACEILRTLRLRALPLPFLSPPDIKSTSIQCFSSFFRSLDPVILFPASGSWGLRLIAYRRTWMAWRWNRKIEKYSKVCTAQKRFFGDWAATNLCVFLSAGRPTFLNIRPVVGSLCTLLVTFLLVLPSVVAYGSFLLDIFCCSPRVSLSVNFDFYWPLANFSQANTDKGRDCNGSVERFRRKTGSILSVPIASVSIGSVPRKNWFHRFGSCHF